MVEEEKRLSLEERRRQLKERREALEQKKLELRRQAELAQETPEDARPPEVPPTTVPPRPAVAETPTPTPPAVTEEVEAPAPAVVEEPKAPAPVAEKVEEVPPGRPPIPPSPPPGRKGKGALIAAVVVIVIAAAAATYLVTTGKLGGGRRGAGPSEEELLAAQARADSVARAQVHVRLRDAEQAIAAAEAAGARDDAEELLALAVASRDSAVGLESEGNLEAAEETIRRSLETAQEARSVAEQVGRDREQERDRREVELRAVAELVAAAQESLAAVEAEGGRKYAARETARLDSTVQAAGTAVNDGDAAGGRRGLHALPVLLVGVRDEIATAKAEEEEVRERLQAQRGADEEEMARQEEERRRAAMESTPPRIVELATPVYPSLARAAGVQGTVVLDFLVDADGSVKDIKVIEGPAALGDAAQDALTRSTIRAATQGGQPVPARMQKRFTFRL